MVAAGGEVAGVHVDVVRVVRVLDETCGSIGVDCSRTSNVSTLECSGECWVVVIDVVVGLAVVVALVCGL